MPSFLAKLRQSGRAPPSSSVPAQAPSEPPAPVLHFPVVDFVPSERPDTHPQPAYLSLSSDLRLLLVRPNEDPPSSLLSFRRPMFRLKLTRMKGVPHGMDLTQTPLQEIIASRVSRVMHRHGPAIRVCEGDKIIQLVAEDEQEREHWMSALTVRLAPLSAIRHRFKAEIRSTTSPSDGGVSVAEAAKEVVRLDAAFCNKSDSKDEHHVSLTNRLWMAVGTSSTFLNWTSSFGQAIAGCAEDVEKLAKPFCQIGVVGCAFSLISLSARAAHLLATERAGRGSLELARKTMHDASLALCKWLVQILGNGFQDEELVGLVFDVIEECWDATARVEMYVLKNWVSRVWKSDEVKDIEGNVAVVRRQLLSVGVLQVLSHELEDVKKRVNALELEDDVEEVFRTFLPDPVQFAAGLLTEATKTTIDRLKERILPQKASMSGASYVESEGNSVRRVALTSVSGEGGIGKTSACRLLCADRDVQNRFACGAILWITLGSSVSDEAVAEEIAGVVADCGGHKKAEEIRHCGSVKTAVNYARQFFDGHRILLVVDNVWKPPKGSDVTDWMGILSKIATCAGSVVLMTTRFRDLCLGWDMDHVRLGRLNLENENSADWKIAEALYDEHVKEDGRRSRTLEQSEKYRITRTKALRISCGLPLAIASICGLIRLRQNNPESVLALIARAEKEGGLAGRSFGKETSSFVGHAGLFAAMSESLEFLDKSEGEDKIFLRDEGDVCASDQKFSADYLRFSTEPVSARYAALEAMDRSSPKLSFSILSKLWHLKSADDAEELSLMFTNLGLGRIERSSHCDDEDVFIVHDLQYDFCCGASRKFGLNGHLLLLAGCMPCLRNGQDWASFCFPLYAPTDSLRLHMGRYLFCHLSRACDGADESSVTTIREVTLGLLTDFCWLQGRGALHGRDGIVQDFNMALLMFAEEACSCFLSACHKHKLPSVATREAILLIRRVLELTPEHAYWCILKSDQRRSFKQSGRHYLGHYRNGELATTFVGRLHQSLIDGWDAVVDVKFVLKLINSTEDNVREGWMRPRNGYLPSLQNDKRILKEMTAGRGEHPVYCVSSLGDGIHIVFACRGIVRIHNTVTSQTSVSFGNGKVRFVAASDTSRKHVYLLFSGGLGVCVRAVEKDVKNNFRELTHTTLDSQEVAQMSVSDNGRRIVALLSKTYNISVWTRSGEDHLIRYGECTSSGGPWGVSLILLSPNGDMMAGTKEETLLLFYPQGRARYFYRSRKRRRNFFLKPSGRNIQSSYNSISSIAFSRDAKSLVVGTRGGALEVWCISSERCIRWIEIHDGRISCVKFLQKTFPGDSGGTVDDLLVVGTANSVKAYDFNQLVLLSEIPVSARPRSISTLRTSDGICEKRFIVLGCDYGYLSIMDVMHVHDIKSPLSLRNSSRQRTGSPIQCVAIAPKRKIIISGHKNGMLCTWDTESGAQSHIFKNVHELDITCIDVSYNEDIAASGCLDGSFVVWDIASLKPRFVHEDRLGAVVYVNITSDNNRIVWCTITGWVKIWNGLSAGPTFYSLSASGRAICSLRNNSLDVFRTSSLFKLLCETYRCFERFPITKHSCFIWERLLRHVRTSWVTLGDTGRARLQFHTGTDKFRNIEMNIVTDSNTWTIWQSDRTIRYSQKSADDATSSEKVINFNQDIYDLVMSPICPTSDSENLVVAFTLEGRDSRVILHFIPPKG